MQEFRTADFSRECKEIKLKEKQVWVSYHARFKNKDPFSNTACNMYL
jgi:hypothetical protein